MIIPTTTTLRFRKIQGQRVSNRAVDRDAVRSCVRLGLKTVNHRGRVDAWPTRTFRFSLCSNANWDTG